MSLIAIFGDICPDNCFRFIFDSRTFGPLSNEIVQDLKKAELVIGNLECPIVKYEKPIAKSGPNLCAKRCDITVLKNAGFRILSLANNHILDYGEEAVQNTINECNKNGILTVGAGANSDKASKPLIVKSGNTSIGIISFAEAEFNLANHSSAGANGFDPYTSYENIKNLKEEVDFLIVLYHGGIEYYKYPSPLLRKKCQGMIRSGASLVLCQHSHCIGTFEEYRDGSILYGQGNSIFGYKKGNASWNEGLLLFIDTDTRSIEMKLLLANENGVCYASKEAERKRITQLFSESQIISNPSALEKEWKKFCLSIAPLDMPLLYGKNRVFIKLNRILKNRLINLFINHDKQMTTMNLIRCESHREVIQTILEEKVFGQVYI